MLKQPVNILKPEEAFVLDLAGFQSEASSTPIHVLEGLDYEEVVRLADIAQVRPLLFRKLEKAEGISADFLSRLRTAYHANLQRNMCHLEETLRIVRTLDEAGIAVMPLKGSVASDIIFSDIGIYPTSDIDILVKLLNMGKVKDALNGIGYTLEENIPEKEIMQSTYHLRFGNGLYILEVHWNLVYRYFRTDPEIWWTDARSVQYEGMTITSPSPEKYMMYGIFRLFARGFSPLRFFTFVNGLIYRYREEIDWGRLISLAKNLRMRRVTLFTLKLLHEMFGTEVPDQVIKKKVAGYIFIRDYTLRSMFAEVTRVHLKMLLYSMLLDSPSDVMKVLFRRIFPPLGEIRLRYNLPAKSKLVYLYYFLNPILLVVRKSKDKKQSRVEREQSKSRESRDSQIVNDKNQSKTRDKLKNENTEV